MRRLTLALAGSILVGLAACTAVEEPNPSKKIVVEESHRCIGACDHIFVEGGWRLVPNHKHGPDCGHYLVNGRWVVDKGEVKPVEADDLKDKKPKQDN